MLDCTHSAAKRATNLHTFTLHGFCYPVRPSLFLSISNSLALSSSVPPSWTNPNEPSSWVRASVSTVAGGRFISSAGARRPFSLVDCQLTDHPGSRSRGQPLIRDAFYFKRGRKEQLLRFNRLHTGKRRDRTHFPRISHASHFPRATKARAYKGNSSGAATSYCHVLSVLSCLITTIIRERADPRKQEQTDAGIRSGSADSRGCHGLGIDTPLNNDERPEVGTYRDSTTRH